MVFATISIVSVEASMPTKVLVIVQHSEIVDQLTSLDNIDTDIFNTSIDLLRDEIGGNHMNALDALSVLRSQSRSGRHSVAAISSDDLLIRFKSSDDFPSAYIAIEHKSIMKTSSKGSIMPL